MQLGVFTFNTEYTMRCDQLARAVEERGFESLWVPEHTHIPVPADVATRCATPPAASCRTNTVTCPDLFTSLAAAAAVTQRIKLGLSICLINQHHPINLAKHVATLDGLSDGRVIFGVGAGWNKGEMGHHGVQFEDRWPQVAERVEALKTIWREERPSSFRGKFCALRSVCSTRSRYSNRIRRSCSARSIRRSGALRWRNTETAGCRSRSTWRPRAPASPTCTPGCAGSAATRLHSRCRCSSSKKAAERRCAETGTRHRRRARHHAAPGC